MTCALYITIYIYNNRYIIDVIHQIILIIIQAYNITLVIYTVSHKNCTFLVFFITITMQNCAVL